MSIIEGRIFQMDGGSGDWWTLVQMVQGTRGHIDLKNLEVIEKAWEQVIHLDNWKCYSNSTSRLRRAVWFLDEALMLKKKESSFLYAVFALEALFSYSRENIQAFRSGKVPSASQAAQETDRGGHRIGKRLRLGIKKLTGISGRKTKRIYDARSEVAHGRRKAEEAVTCELRQDALSIARDCLRVIFLDPRLSEVFSDEDEQKIEDLFKAWGYESPSPGETRP